MMKKRLSKTLWYGTDVDSHGNPVIPPFTADPHDLYGLHVGELFLHFADKATLWSASESGDVVKISGGEGGVDLSKYLLISEFNKIWEIRTDSQGTEYIFGKLPVVTQYGITMYAQDGNIDIPTIAEGLPFDNRTIWFNPTTKKIEVIGGTGGGSGEGVSNFWDLSGIPSWITNTKPTYSYSEIQGTPDLSKYALSSDLAKYIPISGYTDITGEKNFTGGLKVNGNPIYYDTEKKYWKLEGDLLVTGGVTMYGNDSDFVASTIMDAILYDDSTLGINANGELYVKGGTGATTLGSLANVGSWADSVANQDRIMYQAANSSQWVAKNLSDLAVGGVVGDYLPLTGGTISGTSTYPLVVNTTDVQSGIQFLSNNDLLGVIINGGDYGTALINFKGKYRALGIDNDGNAYTTIDYSNTKANLLHTYNYSSYALPLSGGTINGSGDYIYVPLYINALNNQISGITFKTNGTEKGHVGYSSGLGIRLHSSTTAGIAVSDSDEPIFYTADGAIKNTIWHSGNDGSGSGLDADLLDGLHAYISGNNGGVWGYIPSVKSDGVIELGRYIDFHFQSGENIDYATRLYVDAANKNNVALPSSSGTLALLTDNVASSTKLATPRTIWGQSFDGTSDISGSLVIDNPYITWGSLRVGGTSYFGSQVYLFDNISNDANNNSSRLYFAASGYDKGVFLQGINVASYGRKRLGVFVNNEESYSATTWIEALSVLPNGNVGIGTTNPSAKLHVAGDILATGGITMYSDQRKKTILNHVELSLQQVANAPLIEHYYNSDKNKTTHVGSIAQYWAEINDWFCKKDSEGFYTMEIQNAALASAISVARELVKYETETDRRIKVLEEENKRLKEEVEQLKWNIA